MYKVYVRFGFPPKIEKSNKYNGEVLIGLEEGVSVYEAVVEDNIVKILVPTLETSVLVSLSGCIEREDIFIVDGFKVGIGADGEPLLINIKILKKAKIQKGILLLEN